MAPGVLVQATGWMVVPLTRQTTEKEERALWTKMTSSVWDMLSLGTCGTSVRRCPAAVGDVTMKRREEIGGHNDLGGNTI